MSSADKRLVQRTSTSEQFASTRTTTQKKTMRTILITRGLPASGKSSYAKALVAKEHGRWIRVNNDDLSDMMHGGFDRDMGNFLKKVRHSLVKTSLTNGFDVIVDNTNLSPKAVNELYLIAMSIGDVKVIEKCFNVPVEECIERNSKREGRHRIPEKVITDMARRFGLDMGRVLSDKETYVQPIPQSGQVVFDAKLPSAIICDIDGTLALIGDRSPYDAGRCLEVDVPNIAVVECVEAMVRNGHKLIFLSGRSDEFKQQTIQFIDACVSDFVKHRGYDLYMRAMGDNRKDSIIKSELFDEHIRGKFNVMFSLDDRDQVVAHWRSVGLACFQVAPGDF